MEKIKVITIDDNGDEVEHELPAKYEVCSRCEGRGKHVNESIDGHGITESEWEEFGDEFHHDYLSGFYDVTCSVCSGQRVVLVPDKAGIARDPAAREVYKAYLEQQREEADYRAICASERLMGA